MPATLDASEGSGDDALKDAEVDEGGRGRRRAAAAEGEGKRRQVAPDQDPKKRAEDKKQRALGMKKSGGHSGPLYVLLIKALLQAHQRTRDLAGAVFETVSLDTSSSVVLEMQSQTSRYAKIVKSRGKGHGLGPPYFYAFGGLLQALIKKKAEIGASNATVLEKYFGILEAATTEAEKHELIQFCRLDRMYAADHKRLTFAARTSDLRGALGSSLTQLGAERRFGRAPPSFMERELQQWLEALTENSGSRGSKD